jgi:hypothetical protein
MKVHINVKGDCMKKSVMSNVVLAVATSALMFSAYSMADGRHDDQQKTKKLQGCYRVLDAHIEESSADSGHVVGNYKFVLAPNDHKKGKTIVLKGPMSGTEAAPHEEGNEGEEDGEIHGGHILGTDNLIGTLSSTEDSVEVKGASCPSSAGVPQFILAVETFKFHAGTGAFSGLTSGSIAFDVVFDGCTDPSNPVADLSANDGEICFQ